jgi:hypothetical protein
MEKFWKYLTIVMMAALVALSVYGYFALKAKDDDNADLRNALAKKDETIKTLDGAFKKLVVEHDNLKATNKDLQTTIEKAKQEVISAQQIGVYWEGKFNDAVTLLPNPFPFDPGEWKKPGPQKCTAEPAEFRAVNDYGMFLAGCKLYTYDPDTQVHTLVEPGTRPLKLNFALTRDKNKMWHSYVKVEPPDDKVLRVEIGETSVNMEPLEERWYEKLSIHIDLGVGSSGVLGGVGGAYRFGQFNLGPSIWGVTSGTGGSSFYGINFSWSPFKATSP